MRFAEFERNGFGILENVLDAETVSRLIGEVSKLKASNSVRRKNEAVYGVRNLLDLSPLVKEFARCTIVRKIAADFLGKDAKIVRAIFLTKPAMPIGKCRGIRI